MEYGELNGRAFRERQQKIAEVWQIHKEQENREKQRENSITQ